MTAGAASPSSSSPPLLVRWFEATNRWAARRPWCSADRPALYALDILLLVLLVLSAVLPVPVPPAWFQAEAPVFSLVPQEPPLGQGRAVLAPGVPLENRQTYKLEMDFACNPGCSIAVMRAGKQLHDWTLPASITPHAWHGFFRPKGIDGSVPAQVEALIRAPGVGKGIPLRIHSLRLYEFNRIYFEIERIYGHLIALVQVLLAGYFYLRYIRPFLASEARPWVPAAQRRLGGFLRWLHGVGPTRR